MSKHLIWCDGMEYVYGAVADFENKEEFIAQVKLEFNEYHSQRICDKVKVSIETCIYSEKGVPADTLMPLNMTDIVIENYYLGEVS